MPRSRLMKGRPPPGRSAYDEAMRHQAKTGGGAGALFDPKMGPTPVDDGGFNGHAPGAGGIYTTSLGGSSLGTGGRWYYGGSADQKWANRDGGGGGEDDFDDDFDDRWGAGGGDDLGDDDDDRWGAR